MQSLWNALTFELMDGKLGTVEELKAYLEPFSPPAPPPPVHLRRPRAAKKESKAKGRSKKAAAVEISPGEETRCLMRVSADAPGANSADEETPVIESPTKPVKAAKSVAVGEVTGCRRPGGQIEVAKVATAPAEKKAAVTVAPAKKTVVALVKTVAKVCSGCARRPAAPAKKSAPVKAAAPKEGSRLPRRL